MQIFNYVLDSAFSDILWLSVARIMNVFVAVHQCTYETQTWVPCFIIATIPLTV
jgi:hypothetical protein